MRPEKCVLPLGGSLSIAEILAVSVDPIVPHTWSFLQHNSSDESIEIAGRGTYLNLIWLNIRYAKKHTANTTRKNTWAGFFVSGISQLASYNSDLKLTKKVIKLFRSFPLFSSVNGRWTLWSTWEDCSKTCGSGTKARRRSCSNPPPQHGGQACTGPSKQTKSCLLKDCPSKHRVFMFTNNVNIYSLRHNYSYSSDYSANFSGRKCRRALLGHIHPQSPLLISALKGSKAQRRY